MSRSTSRRAFSKHKSASKKSAASSALKFDCTAFSAVVRDLASDGRGIVAHPSGISVFVEGVWPGEEGLFQIIDSKARWATGKLIELLAPATQRVQPFCPHHGASYNSDAVKCGGCPWQFISYAAQLEAKQKRVESALKKISSATVLSIQASPSLQKFRNRAQLKTDGEHIGYHGFNSNKLAAITQCPILTDHNQNTLQRLIEQLPNQHWKPAKRGQHNTLHIDETVSAEQVSINQRLPFQQSHELQNQFMQQWLHDKVKVLDEERCILELFCGSGNFTGVLSSISNTKITAVDCIEEATQALRKEQLPDVEILTLDLYAQNAFQKIVSSRDRFNILVLDPPRSGLQNTEGLFPNKHTFQQIFYVSCDLATFCRDVSFFQNNGFVLKELQPVDIAPHTPHVELLGHLVRKH